MLQELLFVMYERIKGDIDCKRQKSYTNPHPNKTAENEKMIKM